MFSLSASETLSESAFFEVSSAGTCGVTIFAAVKAENAAVSAGQTNLDVALPDDFNATYAVTDAKGNEVKGFKVTEENLASAVSTYAASYTQTKKLVITYPKDAENTGYTLTVSDKSKDRKSVV